MVNQVVAGNRYDISNVPLEANPSNGPQSQEECGMRVALVLGKVGCEVSLIVNEWF